MEPPVALFDSPALAILCELERDGFAVQLQPDEVLVIMPRSRLTPDRMAAIAAHKLDLKQLMRWRDPSVCARLAVMRKQCESAPPGPLPVLVYRHDVPYVPGLCFSCGDALPVSGCFSCGDALPVSPWGRCWRCALAWRLAVGVRVPPTVASACDTARLA